MAAVELAGRGSRVAAVLIDLSALLVCLIPIGLGGGLPGHDAEWSSMLTDPQSIPTFALPSKGIPSLVMLGFALLIAVMVLQLVWLHSRGQTIGKRVLKIKIAQMKTDQNGGFVTNVLMRGIVPAGIDFLIKLIPLAAAFFGLTGLFLVILSWICQGFWFADIAMIFGQDRRRIVDHIAGTQVVKA